MIPIKGSAPSPKIPWVTVGLIAVNVAVFFGEVSMDPAELERVIRTWGFIPAEYWETLRTTPHAVHLWLVPMVTSMFLHGGWAHIIGNMLFLWVFGDGVENRIGSLRFLAFYLLVGIAATTAHAVAGSASAVPTIGASGAIAGVLGAYLLLYPRSSVVLIIPIFFWPLFFQVPTVFFLGLWFVEQLFFGAVSSIGGISKAHGGVAWWAHAGGFIAGLILIELFSIGTSEPTAKQRPRLFPNRPDPRRDRPRVPRDQIL